MHSLTLESIHTRLERLDADTHTHTHEYANPKPYTQPNTKTHLCEVALEVDGPLNVLERLINVLLGNSTAVLCDDDAATGVELLLHSHTTGRWGGGERGGGRQGGRL